MTLDQDALLGWLRSHADRPGLVLHAAYQGLADRIERGDFDTREGSPANVYAWHAAGVPLSVVEKGIRIAVGASVPWRSKWDYAAGVVRNTVADAERRAEAS